MEDLLYLTATEALSRFADKSLSPVELLNAQIARAEATKDTVNAFTYTNMGAENGAVAGGERSAFLGASAPAPEDIFRKDDEKR